MPAFTDEVVELPDPSSSAATRSNILGTIGEGAVRGEAPGEKGLHMKIFIVLSVKMIMDVIHMDKMKLNT